ncbi:hypothetical protein VNO77_37565 [Canavalia gladiata]|uniref:Transmembrane protein n=1 Tax=Canavalia gladiata TaxID=3824 RepID=A0AAN9PUU8_CANGL
MVMEEIVGGDLLCLRSTLHFATCVSRLRHRTALHRLRLFVQTLPRPSGKTCSRLRFAIAFLLCFVLDLSGAFMKYLFFFSFLPLMHVTNHMSPPGRGLGAISAINTGTCSILLGFV